MSKIAHHTRRWTPTIAEEIHCLNWGLRVKMLTESIDQSNQCISNSKELIWQISLISKWITFGMASMQAKSDQAEYTQSSMPSRVVFTTFLTPAHLQRNNCSNCGEMEMESEQSCVSLTQRLSPTKCRSTASTLRWTSGATLSRTMRQSKELTVVKTGTWLFPIFLNSTSFPIAALSSLQETQSWPKSEWNGLSKTSTAREEPPALSTDWLPR